MMKRIFSLVVVLVVVGFVASVLAVELCEGQTITSTSSLVPVSERENNFTPVLTSANATSAMISKETAHWGFRECP
jgi:molybdopterin-binding protein